VKPKDNLPNVKLVWEEIYEVSLLIISHPNAYIENKAFGFLQQPRGRDVVQGFITWLFWLVTWKQANIRASKFLSKWPIYEVFLCFASWCKDVAKVMWEIKKCGHAVVQVKKALGL
jgi:hypothetical protein